MAHQLFTLPKQVNLDASANILAGAKATFYLTQTSTLQDTYSDSALTTPNANPVVADSNGVFSPIYLDPAKTYKVTLTTAAGVLLYTADPANDQVLSQAVIGGYLYPVTDAETSAGVTVISKQYPAGHAFRYMTDVQIADVLGYAYGEDVTAAVQAAIDIGPGICPDGGYSHTGLNLSAQGKSLRGQSYYGTIFNHTGSGDGLEVESGCHHCEISNVTLNGNNTMASGTAVLKWTNAAWGKLDRVTINAGGLTGAGSVVFILQEASFDLVMSHCQVDGEGTAETGMICRDNGAASGPNTLTVRDSRIQQCTQLGLDLQDGNNLVFVKLEVAEMAVKGVKVGAPLRTTSFYSCRFDWTADGSVGVEVESGAQDTKLTDTHWDIGGSGIQLLADSGARTSRQEGNEFIGATVIGPSLEIKDLSASKNPAISFTTSDGVQRIVFQYTGTTCDIFSAGDWRVRTNAGAATPLQAGAGNTLGVFGTAAIAKPTVTGAKGGNAALTSLCTQLAALGWITDSTT